MGIVAINGCLEMDVQGQVNSIHLLGTKILTGIAGSYDSSRKGLLLIFLAPSTAPGGKISSVVPMVSHVDHTEHDVDILLMEQGLADLRGLDPLARAETIVRQCAYPDFQGMLSDYLYRAKKSQDKSPSCRRNPVHLRLTRSGSMKKSE